MNRAHCESEIPRDARKREDRNEIDPEENILPFEREYGASLSTKDDKHIRIMTQNIRFFPIEGRNEARYDLFKRDMQDGQYDIIGLSETNYNWNNLSDDEQIHQQTRGWWRNQAAQKSWLKSEDKNERQIGGTATIVTNNLTSYITNRGEDDRKLGRWSWMTISDPTKTIHTTILTLYHPCRTFSSGSVNGQQLQKIREKYPHMDEDTFSLYTKDLQKLIKSQLSDTHHMIVMGDLNQNTTGRSKLVRMLKMVGLRDPIHEKHGGSIPATHINGSLPIDVILCSPHINIIDGGHCKGDINISDHKIIWIDIDRATLLGDTKEIVRPMTRKLISHHPTIRKEYNKKLEEILHKQGGNQKLRKLQAAVASKNKERIAEEYEGLDELRRRAIKCAEHRCRKIKKGNVPFSPTLTTAIGQITMWKLLYKALTCRGQYKPRARFLRRKAKKWGFPEENLSINETSKIQDELVKAIKNYHRIRKSAKTLRLSYLEKKAEALELEGGKYSNHLKKLIHIEEQKEVFKKIKYSQQEYSNSSLSYIEMGPDEGPRITITDKEVMEQKTMDANIQKLTQADSTPFYIDPLLSEYKADTLDFEKWEGILDPHKPIPTSVEHGTRLWFEQMKRCDNNIPPSTVTFNEASYQTSWKKMKETTSSHPGLHFGHFKSMQEESPLANQIHTALANVPLIIGYSPKSWRVCTNAMLRKKSNDARPEKLRLITLMDAQFNHNNKHLGRTMMRNGEKHSHLATEQYGSRKNKSAVEHALNKVLTIDLSRLKREEMVFIANDAVSCYDRILLMSAYLTMLKFGIPAEAAQSVITTLGEMTHHIRTAKGDSTQTYGGLTWVRLPHGIGQGNGSGPAIWACVSTPLFEALREDGYGVNIMTPISNLLLNITGFAFVDDTDLIQNMGRLGNVRHLMLKAQQQLITWEELLRTTGGAIDPKKSDWLYIRYKWKNADWAYIKTPYPTELLVRDKNNVTSALRQLHINEARETLGVWIAGTGQWSTQSLQLKKKSQRWTSKLHQGRMQEDTTQIALRTTIYRSLAYSLPATYMSAKECKEALQPLIYGTLPRLGVVRTMSRTAVHLPSFFGGLGIPELYVMQGIEHVKILLLHGGTSTATGILLQAITEYHMLESGSFKSLYQLPPILLPILTRSWLKSTLLFLQQNNIQIETDIHPLRQWSLHDRSLMDVLCHRGSVTQADLHVINKCRMHLKVITTSDIFTPEGTIISKCWECSQYTSLSSIRYDWPRCPRPSSADILVWQRALYNILRATPGKSLTQQSFPFYLTDAQDHAPWRIDPRTNNIWEARDQTWNMWTLALGQRHTRQRRYIPTSTVSNRSQSTWHLAIVADHDEHILLLCSGPSRGFQQPPSIVDPWIKVGNINEGPQLHRFLEELRNGKGRCISDGSAKDGRASMAFRSIGSDRTDIAFEGSQGIPGAFEDNNSFRGEAAGLLGIIVTINFLCTLHNIQHGGITVGCDSKGALQAAFHHPRVQPCQASRDIIQAIHFQLKQSPLEWETKHVRGHQDDVKSTLTDWEEANVDVDEQANLARTAMDSIPAQTKLSGETWRVLLRTQVINSNLEQRLLSHCWRSTAIKYWIHRGRMLPNTSKKIHWQAYAKGIKLLPTSKAQCLTKLFSGFHATGRNMFRRRQWSTDTCPMCDNIEDHIHVLQCTSPQASSHFANAYGDLDDWLGKTTSEEVAEAVYLLLSDYRENNFDSDQLYDYWSPLLKNTVRHQRSIGPRSFVEGFLSTKWEDLQLNYYISINDNRHSALRWTGLLIKHLHNLFHLMWTQRCDVLHSDDGQKELHQLEYATDLARLLSDPPPPSMPANDRRFFVPLETALSYSLPRQRRLITLLQTCFTSHEIRTSSKSATLLKSWLATAAAP